MMQWRCGGDVAHPPEAVVVLTGFGNIATAVAGDMAIDICPSHGCDDILAA